MPIERALKHKYVQTLNTEVPFCNTEWSNEVVNVALHSSLGRIRISVKNLNRGLGRTNLGEAFDLTSGEVAVSIINCSLQRSDFGFQCATS